VRYKRALKLILDEGDMPTAYKGTAKPAQTVSGNKLPTSL
jgi:hypothetical protein